ncbi:hypothetical protein Tco_1437242 [Tanacetum coccineum]
MISTEPTLFRRPTIVEFPKELPKVSMVNTSLKKLKHHLAGFDVVVKERTTPTAITEGSWGFKHTKACFRDEIIPFVKALKDLFNTFNQYLVDELSEVQSVFHQMEQAVEQHRLESKTFEVKMNQVLNENKRLLEHVLSKDIVNILVNSSVNIAFVNVHECEKYLKLETELLNKKDFEEATVLRDLVEHVKSKYLLDQSLESACSQSQPSKCFGNGEGLPTWLLYNWDGLGSRVDEMILARERSGFAEEKVWGDIPVVTGFWGGKEDFLGELAVWSPEDV